MSVEPPIVKLAGKPTTWEEFKHRLPNLADHFLALGNKPEDFGKHGAVLVTRNTARKIIEDRPEAFRERMVYLDARGVEVASPGFFDELLKACPRAQLVGASREVQECFDLAAEHVRAVRGRRAP